MITIIGAGPVGNYLACLLAKDYDVRVYEEHKKIGLPVQCTGLTTSALADIIKLKKDFIVNKVGNARIISPSGLELDIKLKKPNLVLDRAKFDQFLADEAKDKGADYFLNHKLLNCKLGKKIELNFNKNKTETDFLIGADGPLSKVAKSANLFGKRKFINGLQARAKLDLNKDIIEFYLGYGIFSWIVPETSKIARIGVTSYNNSCPIYLKKLLKKKNAKVINYQAGLIPLYNPRIKTKKNNVFLVGDAATQVKATTFGGILPGLIAAKELAKSPKDYERNWKREIGKELFLHLILRKRMDRFLDRHYDKLVYFFKKEKLKELIGNYDRDFLSKFVFKLLIREPRLLQFI